MVKSTEHRRDLGYSPAPEIPPVQTKQIIYHQQLLLLSRFSRVRLCVIPQTAAHQAPLSLGFSRQEHWSGLPLPSPERALPTPKSVSPSDSPPSARHCNHHLCSHHGIVSVLLSHPKSSQSPSSVILSPRFCSYIAPFLHPHCHCDIPGLKTVALDRCNSCQLFPISSYNLLGAQAKLSKSQL